MMGVAVMKEKLERLKVRQTNLVVEIKGLARDIMDRINPAMVDDIVDMKVPEAAAMMDSLVVKQGELLSLRSRIWDLEEALGY